MLLIHNLLYANFALNISGKYSRFDRLGLFLPLPPHIRQFELTEDHVRLIR